MNHPQETCRLLRPLVLMLSATWLSLVDCSATSGQSRSIDIEAPPINYSDTTADNRVSRMLAQIAKGEIKLEFDNENGNLRSLLQHLEISETSQVLVFSKTSLQVQHITPRNPRAIYFNDDTYVGWIRGSQLVEISTNDSRLGAAFYSVHMSPGIPRIRQETYQCLSCHSTSMTQGIPGHTIRSGFPTYDGQYDVQRESFVTDDRSDFSQRWGGWYVTGSHGDLQHMGNTYLRGGQLDKSRNRNLQTLGELFDTRHYIAAHSDIQALMVLEHQTQMHNSLTRADFGVRLLQFDSPDLDPAERDAEIRLIARELVQRLFFCNEFPLSATITGTSGFDKAFTQLGPRDARGRGLRDFDMKSRMFKYPLSYLIYSSAFDSLQPPLRSEVCKQIKLVLDGTNQAAEFQHLTREMRQEILEIVQATKPDMLN